MQYSVIVNPVFMVVILTMGFLENLSDFFPGSKKKPCYPLRRPSLESDPLPRIKANSSLPSLRKVEPGVVDLLAMADRKMNSLNHEVTALRAELSIQTDNVYTLKSQVHRELLFSNFLILDSWHLHPLPRAQ